ncbi:MAG: hydrogenase expression/formation protein HypE [Oscillospiraceae bacterium]|nr:hydrogenase expression/formation protein HypE [Oscillospiraceae bacterium]
MKIKLSHGNGGAETSELIESIFMKYFQNEYARLEDAAVLPLNLQSGQRLAFTTDSFVVNPLFFPGGNIGRLSVCGTVNDLLTTGGNPLYLSASFIIEENTDTDIIDAAARSMREAADEAGVLIVTGDTKVIENGNNNNGGGLYINTAGVGIAGNASVYNIVAGDAILVSGNLGDHHACILSQRMGIQNNIQSDAAPITEIVNALVNSAIPVHCIRDVTRGGLATVLNEAANAAGLSAGIDENSLPVSDEVRGLCRILGLDPLYMGNEGKMMIVVPEQFADEALGIIIRSRYGENAALIGRFAEGNGVALNTKIGGKRKLPPLSGEGLPRIC